MQPKEQFLRALRYEESGEIPWLPLIGVHAGALSGIPADEVYRSAGRLLPALLEAHRLYEPSAMPVVYDLQLEAECLSCKLTWAPDAPPAVSSHPLEGEFRFVPCECTLPGPEDGRIPMVLDVMRRMKGEVGERTALCGVVCGPFTLAAHLRGSDLFMDLYDDGDYVRELLDFCRQGAERMAEYYLDAGMDVIIVADPLASQVAEGYFGDFLAQPYKAILDRIRALGGLSLLSVCGDIMRCLEDLCKTGPDGLLVDEDVDLSVAKQVTDRCRVALAGNLPLTGVMLGGTPEENMRYLLEERVGVEDTRGLILATGCDIPYAVPADNALAAALAARHPEEAASRLAKGGA